MPLYNFFILSSPYYYLKRLENTSHSDWNPEVFKRRVFYPGSQIRMAIMIYFLYQSIVYGGLSFYYTMIKMCSVTAESSNHYSFYREVCYLWECLRLETFAHITAEVIPNIMNGLKSGEYTIHSMCAIFSLFRHPLKITALWGQYHSLKRKEE